VAQAVEAAAEKAPYDGLQQKEGGEVVEGRGEVVEGRGEGGGLRSASASLKLTLQLQRLHQPISSLAPREPAAAA
jgi:hypothetical protein